MNVQPRPIPRVIYKLDVLSGQIVGYPSCGEGVDFLGSDPNHLKKPSVPYFLGGTPEKPVYTLPAPVPISKIGKGIQFVGSDSAEPPVDKRLAKDSPHQVSNRDGAAIF